MGLLEDIQIFIRIAEAGGIGRAADQLGLAKSAVSRRLSQLEKQLGIRLINRTTRMAGLTDAGQQYYERASKVIADITAMNSDISTEASTVTGTLRVALPLSFGLMHLCPLIEVFSRSYPSLSIQLEFSDRKICLVEEGFDLAFRVGELEDSSLQARPIAPIRLLMAASPAYLKQHGMPKTPPELKQHRILQYTGSNHSSWQFKDSSGNQWQLNLTTKLMANNGDFLRDMAIAGHGILMQPSFIIWEALAAKKLVQVLPDCTIPSIQAYAIYPRNRYLPQRARLLIDFIANQFGDIPYWDQNIKA